MLVEVPIISHILYRVEQAGLLVILASSRPCRLSRLGSSKKFLGEEGVSKELILLKFGYGSHSRLKFLK